MNKLLGFWEGSININNYSYHCEVEIYGEMINFGNKELLGAIDVEGKIIYQNKNSDSLDDKTTNLLSDLKGEKQTNIGDIMIQKANFSECELKAEVNFILIGKPKNKFLNHCKKIGILKEDDSDE